jgi:hypothetical protein
MPLLLNQLWKPKKLLFVAQSAQTPDWGDQTVWKPSKQESWYCLIRP